jgi:drug/metabolite transporter (DMT)-like permease
MPILFAGLTSLGYGIADFFGGLATRRAPALSVAVVSQTLGFSVLIVAAPLLGGEGVWRDFAWGASAGFGGAAAIVVLYHALSRYRIGVVAPVAALVSAVIPVVFGVAVGERPAPIAWIGIALALPAILLVTADHGKEHEDRREVLRGMALGALAGVGFALFFVLISRAGDDAGLWPLVGARAVSIPAMVVAALIGRVPLTVPRKAAAPTVAAGFLDMSANIFFLLAVQRGFLSLVSVISSLYPGATLVLARTVLKERIIPLQGLGLVLAAVAVSLIAIA